MIDLSMYDTIMFYLAKDDEVSCDVLIQELLDMDKTVLVPYTKGGVLKAVQLYSFEDVEMGERGIRTIKTQNFRSDDIDCIVCPGRLFTRDGQRKGRGGGWYDRFLAQYPESHKIGLCYEDQIVNTLEQRSWDIMMDEMIIIS